ncbi:hypothetical protein [Budvicia aquatica]|uniref:Uncharacterized protein n=1 Tax=Budvicia aquatica TaxID=82979 RepID=A0A484ZH95_9GAMM|nr:hypothetical protein [Budvicia aquatica]VFS47378.1 Uncharacterised protein [Budvicia aquatica]
MAIIVVGTCIIAFAIKNYLDWSSSALGLVNIRVPRVLSYLYDALGFVPGSILQIIMGLCVIGYGIFVFKSTNKARNSS